MVRGGAWRVSPILDAQGARWGERAAASGCRGVRVDAECAGASQREGDMAGMRKGLTRQARRVYKSGGRKPRCLESPDRPSGSGRPFTVAGAWDAARRAQGPARKLRHSRKGRLMCETLWSKKQVAEFLGVSQRTVDNLRKSDGLPSVKVSRVRVGFIPAAVRAWVERRQVCVEAAQGV